MKFKQALRFVNKTPLFLETMNILRKFTLLLLLLSFKSCNSSKTAKNENSTEKSTAINHSLNKALINEGYSLGTIQYVNDLSCAYIIIDENSQTKFDPININDKRFMVFRKDSLKIYYKFRRLRMSPRCQTIQPIELTDIKKEKH